MAVSGASHITRQLVACIPHRNGSKKLIFAQRSQINIFKFLTHATQPILCTFQIWPHTTQPILCTFQIWPHTTQPITSFSNFNKCYAADCIFQIFINATHSRLRLSNLKKCGRCSRSWYISKCAERNVANFIGLVVSARRGSTFLNWNTLFEHFLSDST